MADDFSSQLDAAFGAAPPLTIKGGSAQPGQDFSSQLDAAFPGKAATEPQPDRGSVDATVRGLANAIPGMTHIAAAGDTLASYLPRSVGQYLTPNPNDQSGEPLSQRYAENLGAERGVDATTYNNHPVISTLAPIAGAIAALPVAGPAEAVSAGVSRVAPRIVGDIAGSAAVGAGYGAAYGADAGDSVSDSIDHAKTGAIYGGVGGALAPPVARVLGRAANAALTKVGAPEWLGGTSADAVAAGNIKSAIQQDAKVGNSALSPSDYTAAIRNGQNPTVVDLGGEATRSLAQRVVNQSPEARAIVKPAVAERFANQQPEFASWLKARFGTDLDNAETQAQLIADAKGVNTPAYKQAYADGANGVWSPELGNIVQSPLVQDVLPRANDMANDFLARNGQPKVRAPFTVDANGTTQLGTDSQGNTATPSLAYWDQVKRGLDAKIGQLNSSGQKALAIPLIDAKNQLLDELDKQVPSYANARQGAFEAFGVQNAFAAGQKFATAADNMGINTIKAAQAKMTPREQDLFAQGFAANVMQKVMNPSESVNAVRMFTSPTMRDKIDTALGSTTARALEAHANRAAAMDLLRTKLGNSTTVMQDEDRKASGGGHGIIGTITGALGPTLSGAATGAYGAHELGGGMDDVLTGAAVGAFTGMMTKRVKGMNAAVAKATAEQLMSSDPAVVNAAIARTAKDPQLMNGLRSTTAYLMGSAAPKMPALGTSQEPQQQPAYARGGSVRSKASQAAMNAALMARPPT